MSFTTSVYYSPNELLAAVEDDFRRNPHSSNVIYAHAVKASSSAASTGSSNNQTQNLWMVVWHGSAPSVAFVLSCATGPLGAYPIFIYTPLSTTHLHDDFVRTGTLAMVDALSARIPPERVFSVFAVDALARAFATAWTAKTGVQLEHATDPVYYHAALMYCNSNTFQDLSREVPFPSVAPETTFVLRAATDSDLSNAISLCYGFAAESEPFVLSCDRAAEEARLLIENRQLWVHETRVPGQEPELASIVAVTRVTGTVAAITKVYTNPRWRKHGCAERLTRYVCDQLLRTKKEVVLYVGHRNPARKVYQRIGFVGFESLTQGETDSWLELGFDRSRVELGHW